MIQTILKPKMRWQDWGLNSLWFMVIGKGFK